MPNIKPDAADTPQPLDEAYPRDGHTEVDPRAQGGTLNPENPGFAGQGYQDQGMASPRSEMQREMENGDDPNLTGNEEE